MCYLTLTFCFSIKELRIRWRLNVSWYLWHDGVRIKQMICEPLFLIAVSPWLEITLTVFQFVLFITFSVVFSFNLGYLSFNWGKKNDLIPIQCSKHVSPFTTTTYTDKRPSIEGFSSFYSGTPISSVKHLQLSTHWPWRYE